MAEDFVMVPSGCAWCGVEKRVHFGRWHDDAGWHVWTQPTPEQIKARMLARRDTT